MRDEQWAFPGVFRGGAGGVEGCSRGRREETGGEARPVQVFDSSTDLGVSPRSKGSCRGTRVTEG